MDYGCRALDELSRGDRSAGSMRIIRAAVDPGVTFFDTGKRNAGDRRMQLERLSREVEGRACLSTGDHTRQQHGVAPRAHSRAKRRAVE
jgi:hypothetical protein